MGDPGRYYSMQEFIAYKWAPTFRGKILGFQHEYAHTSKQPKKASDLFRS